MKNLLKKKSKLIVLLLIASLLELSCSTSAEEGKLKVLEKSQLILIAPDQSGSFTQKGSLDYQFFQTLCSAVNASGIKTTIGVLPIGSPSDNTFLRLDLETLPTFDRNATIRKQAKVKKRQEEVFSKNRQKVEEFLQSIDAVLNLESQEETDLNGFFAKANEFIQEPQFEGAEKVIFVYSDGLHDVAGEHQLSCELPKEVNLCLSGWKSTQYCNVSATVFESPDGFLQYFINTLNKSS